MAGSAGVHGRNLTYSMLDALGREIVTGGYDGRRFPTEAELAKAHGVSRSVTREAVKMLTAKGLLTARPRKGTTVQPGSSWNLFDPDVLRWLLERKFSLELLRQFSELRIAIEPAAAALAGASIIINASPLGMAGSPLMPASLLESVAAYARGATLLDMVYKPVRTAFLEVGEANGGIAVDGLAMLVGQARAAFELFFGRPPPAPDRALRDLIAS